MKKNNKLIIPNIYAKRPSYKEFGLTPMMVQFLKVKENNLDNILFYRMGDFYEMFFEDAILASSLLEITLTKRGEWNSKNIPMCGVPAHSAETYIEKLIKKGYRVSICEQIEKEALAQNRGPMHREVVRVITPGTVTEDSLLNPEFHNYLASISKVGNECSVSWVDLTTGNFFVEKLSNTSKSSIDSALERLKPKEIIISRKLEHILPANSNACISFQSDNIFNSAFAEDKLKNFFNVISLESFGNFGRSCLSASGSIISYIELTQKGQLPLLEILKMWKTNDVLEIDSITRRSLEIMNTYNGEIKGSLYNSINYTVTRGGGRLLSERLNAPLVSHKKIEERLDMVSMFFNFEDFLKEFKLIIFKMPDLLRALSRLQFNRAGPRDLASIKDGIFVFNEIIDHFKSKKLMQKPKKVKSLVDNLKIEKSLLVLLKSALAETLPILTKDGNFIKNGYSKELDYLRNLRDQSKKHIALLQKKYVDLTSISSLKIKHNNVLGYHIEIRNIHINKISENKKFIHRQTTAQAARYSTIELSELEKNLLSANSKTFDLENKLFENLRQKILNFSEKLIVSSNSLSELDVASSNATLALEWNYCRPILTKKPNFKIKNGRHPVLEQITFEKNDNRFLGNDCNLKDDNNIWLITGPNMAGKSTFLRQNALINILAQMGSFVPAEEAMVGISDRIFSRVGSADDITKGQSTFMVEMLETATILNQATKNSFIILDEIGRGTSTWDGLSLAWSIIEYIHEKISARTLFATHYHELSVLQKTLKKLSLHSIEVREIDDEIIFLYRMTKGSANKSYGIEVAKLAGMPAIILQRAKEVLEKLEKGSSSKDQIIKELPLFKYKQNTTKKDKVNPVIEKINKIEPDEITPMKALEILYELKKIS